MTASPSTLAHVAAFDESPTQRADRTLRWVIAMIGFGALAILAVLPVAKMAGPELPAIVPLFSAGIFVAELATSYLLFVLFDAARRWSLVLLACAYLYAGLMAVLHVLTFPGALLPDHAVIGTVQSAGWAFHFWVCGYAVLTLSAILLEAHGARVGECSVRAVALGITATLLVFAFVVLAVSTLADRLPPLVQGGSWTIVNHVLTYLSIGLMTLGVALILLIVRQKDPLFLWLSLALAAVVFANVLSLAAAGRYTIGWSVARLSWGVSAGVLFLFFLTQFAREQHLLAQARDMLEQRVAERTRELSAEIAERQRAEEEERRGRVRIDELQTELQHASHMSTLGLMASGLAHELNQPLTAARNYLSALRRIVDALKVDRNKVREIAAQADGQVTRLGDVVHHMRQFVARGDTERQFEDINATIEAAASLGLIEARHRGVSMLMRLSQGLPLVLINRVQIQQVVVNLVRNAAEAMDGLPVRNLTIATAFRQDARAVEITVADSGPGIAPDIMARLFQPFVTSKDMGMGLGLSICQDIVHAHGGRIAVEANQPRGTIFTISLPLPGDAEA